MRQHETAFATGGFARASRRARPRVLCNSVVTCALQDDAPLARMSRRQFHALGTSAALSAVFFSHIDEANAISGLKIFPLREQLTNTYYLMRAGESVSDARGIARSNPVEKVS